jgi:feruloyl esterase
VVGKEITKIFYGKPHTKSYYVGCSTGGRQGWKSVQENPEDFDGVVAGSPAIGFTGLFSWSSSFYNITGPVGSPTYIPYTTWPLIRNDTLKQCDALDGAEDGILEDPDKCNYDPSGLLCKPNMTSGTCLTQPQVDAVKKMYKPLVNDEGKPIYPRLNPGTAYPAMMIGGSPFTMAQDWFRYVVYEDPSFNILNVKLSDYDAAAKQNAGDVHTFNGDLSRFKARGGRVLTYHGHDDSMISSGRSKEYYEHVKNTMKLTSAQLDEFYRYFPISGMDHCGGGLGAHDIGQRGAAESSTGPNLLNTIVRWVENGIAPETLLGKGRTVERKHCRYPRQNRLKKGAGSFSKAENWDCVM